MKKINRRDETRERILNAAEGLISRLSFHGMRMEHLSEYIGLSRKTLYNHFPGGKRDIWKHCVERRVCHYSSLLFDIAEDTKRDYVERGMEIMDIGREAMEVFYGPRGMVRSMEEGEYLFPQVQQRFVDVFSRFFSEGRERGFLRADLPVRSLSLVIVGLIVNWWKKDSYLGDGEVASLPEFVERVMFEGILSKEGRRRIPLKKDVS